MILRLLRFAIPWRLPLFVALAIVVPIAAAGHLVGGSVGGSPVFILATDAPLLLMLLAVGTPAKRATLFEAALPIPGRQLFLARTLNRLALVWLPVGVIVVMLHHPRDPALLSYVLGAGALATVAILLPQAIRPSDLTASTNSLVASVTGIVAGGALAWYLVPPSIALAIFGTAVPIAFVVAWRAVPPSFQTVPTATEGVASLATVGSAYTTRGTTRPAWWGAGKSALPLGSFFVFGLTALVGLSGGSELLFYVLIFVPAAAAASRRRTRWMAGLPISHRALLLMTLVASAAPVMAGIGVGLLGRRQLFWNTVNLAINDGPMRLSQPFFGSKTRETAVDLEFWRLAPDGQVPEIRSPGGETVAPTTISILGIRLYNPYYVRPDNTDDFVAWQVQRAANVVYGRPISLTGRYSAAEPVGPTVAEQPRMLILSAAALLGLLLYLQLVVEIARSHRLRRPSATTRRTLRVGLLSAPIAALLLADFWGFFLYHTWVSVPLVRVILLHALPALPQNPLAVTAISAAPVLAMYWLLEQQFSKSEFADQPRLAPGLVRSASGVRPNLGGA